jgi:putative heme-binding domain-containing protein
LLPAKNADVDFELLRLLVFLRAPSAVAKGMQLIAERGESKPVSWSGVEKLNARYGNTLKQITKNPPPTEAIDIAFVLRNARNGWTPELRRQYFTFLNTAAKANGGASYPGYLTNIREEALATCSDSERTALADLTGEDFNPVPDFAIEPPVGPGHPWTLEEALAATESMNPKKLSYERGRSLFHSVSCGACHRFTGLGGGVGPDLTSVPNKFTKQYLVEAIVNPSKDVSDQYQAQTVLTSDGQVLSGIVIEQDNQTVLIYSSDPKVAPHRVSTDAVEEIRPSQVSQMPNGLLDRMNADELRDLMAYILSGGEANHKIFRGRK